jgi:DNA-binding XRE family transcriptional regulator
MSEDIEKVTGIQASSINLLIYLFQSILLETGVFVIAFFLGVGRKEREVISEAKELVEDNNNGNGTLTGQKLREIRIQIGKSQEELAKELGINPMKLSRIENGKSKFDKSILDRLVGLNML